MLILIAFAAIVLLAAGFVAVQKGDTVAFAALLIVLVLIALVVVPQALLLIEQLQRALDAVAPLALR